MELLLRILGAVPVTLTVTLVSFAFGAVLGIVLAAGRRSRFGIVRVVAKGIIDVLRGIPPLVFVMLIFFGVPYSVLPLQPLHAAIIGLSLISAGQLAEVYRGGILAVHFGQFEAAAALGLARTSTFVDVIGPQAVRVAIPGMVTWLISLLKDSSVVSAIGVAEVMLVAKQAATSGTVGALFVGHLIPFLVAGAVYIALGAPLAALSRFLVVRLTPEKAV